MYAEAMESLRSLFQRYPNHRLLVAKMREIEALEGGVEPVGLETPPAGNNSEIPVDVEDPHELETAGGVEHTGGTSALEIDEIEEMSDDDLLMDEEPGASQSMGGGKRKPTVMLEKPVDEGDAETHYDLGLAYKEMGLFDEAIKAFEKVLRVPGREIQCRVMIGMCHREQGNQSEAIHEFKQGLHANGSDRERLSLYYEIGITYEAMGDTGEALYYFDAVVKRDPRFADAAQRAEQLRARGSQPIVPDDDI